MTKYIDADKLVEHLYKMLEKYPKNYQILVILEYIDSLQQEQPMPDSTQLIEWWHEDKEMLKEKDFRDDPWRLAYNAFMCGFGRGIAVKKQEQPEVDFEKAFAHEYAIYHLPDFIIASIVDGTELIDFIYKTARHFAEWGATHINARKED